MEISLLIQSTYLVAAALFIIGLKRMSSPLTARGGIVWAGVGMLMATLVTFLEPNLDNIGLMIVAIVLSSTLAWVSGKKVAMTDMPQMIALYNGMGGGAAAAIAAIELVKGTNLTLTIEILALLGAFIGTVAFSGSLIAFAKLQGIIRKALRFPGLPWINLALFLGTVAVGVQIILTPETCVCLLALFFGLSLLLGVLVTAPIGGADMPVVISLFNALTGLAVGFEGFVLGNPAMMIAGTVVGASGTMLTQLMAKAMNRSISNVLFSSFGESGDAGDSEGPSGTMKAVEASDAAITLTYAEKVIIVPGYGLAVAQAQHKIWELAELLEDKGVSVKFAIHPVAGRMPGHMNVLLAEAGVPYEKIADLDEINSEFDSTNVALVIGANDVVNPAARTNKSSPIYGMPILNADKADNVIVIKRGQGTGFSGIENELFFADNTRLCYGDGQKVVAKLIAGVKAL